MQNDANSSFEQTGILKLNGLFRKLKPMLPIGPFHQAKSISFLQPLRPTEVDEPCWIRTKSQLMLLYFKWLRIKIYQTGNCSWLETVNGRRLPIQKNDGHMLVPQTGISTLGWIFSANYAMKEWNQRFYSSNQNPSIPRDSHLGSSGISPGCVKMQRTYGCIMSHEKCRDVSELHEMCLPFGRIDPCWICKAFRLHWSLLVVRIYEKYERFFPNEFDNLLWTYYLIQGIYLSKELTRLNDLCLIWIWKNHHQLRSSKMKFFLKTGMVFWMSPTKRSNLSLNTVGYQVSFSFPFRARSKWPTSPGHIEFWIIRPHSRHLKIKVAPGSPFFNHFLIDHYFHTCHEFWNHPPVMAKPNLPLPHKLVLWSSRVFQSDSVSRRISYCWWKKSCTSWYVVYPSIYMVLCIPGGAGFQPSTVGSTYEKYLMNLTHRWQGSGHLGHRTVVGTKIPNCHRPGIAEFPKAA